MPASPHSQLPPAQRALSGALHLLLAVPKKITHALGLAAWRFIFVKLLLLLRSSVCMKHTFLSCLNLCEYTSDQRVICAVLIYLSEPIAISSFFIPHICIMVDHVHLPRQNLQNRQVASLQSVTRIDESPSIVVIVGTIPATTASTTASTTVTYTYTTSTTSTSGAISTSSTQGSQEAHNSSSKINLGITIGCILGGIALVALLTLLFRRLEKRRGPIEPILATSLNQAPHQSNRDDVAASSNDPLHDQHRITRSPPFHSASESTTLVPFPPEYQPLHVCSTKNRDELRAMRQTEINQRLQTAQQEMQNLTSRQSAVSGEPGPDSSSSSEVRRQGTEHEMDAMREQIRQISTQMQQLQMQLSSDWAQGLSDEPPPAY